MAHIVGGIIAAVLGIMGIIGWWDNFGDFLRGFIPLVLFVGGIIAISTGMKLKEKEKTK